MAEEPRDDAQTAPEEEEERSGSYMEFEPSTDPVVRSTARTVRRIGFTITGVLILWMNIPILIGVIGGALANEARDPDSGRVIPANYPHNDCERWGLELLEASPRDPEAVAAWSAGCASAQPEIAASLKRVPASP